MTPRPSSAWILGIVAAGLALLGPTPARSRLVPCRGAREVGQVAAAFSRLRARVDPCGESAQILAVLDRLERCPRASYRICTDRAAGRNLFDHASGPRGTITWNPGLRSELEPACDGDPARPVRRDPTASLLHEIVHAVHDCEGEHAGEDEFEAVRIENIYRRAGGLCQRGRYGDDPLPREMVRTCTRQHCACAAPSAVDAGWVAPRPGVVRRHRSAADSVRSSGHAHPDSTR